MPIWGKPEKVENWLICIILTWNTHWLEISIIEWFYQQKQTPSRCHLVTVSHMLQVLDDPQAGRATRLFDCPKHGWSHRLIQTTTSCCLLQSTLKERFLSDHWVQAQRLLELEACSSTRPTPLVWGCCQGLAGQTFGACAGLVVQPIGVGDMLQLVGTSGLVFYSKCGFHCGEIPRCPEDLQRSVNKSV